MNAAYHFPNNTVNCPICKGVTVFKSVDTNIIVCGICNSSMERLEGGFTKVLPLEVGSKETPLGLLQIGTRGTYKTEGFEIIGCLRCNAGDYYSNRWTLLFTNGMTGLLVEALGFYAFYEKVVSDFPSMLKTVENTKVGSEQVQLLRGKNYTIFDRAQYTQASLYGEIFLWDAKGIFNTTELGELNGDRMELVERQKEVFELFTVKYVELVELSLTNLNAGGNTSKLMYCGKCNAPITVILPQQSTHCVCSKCKGWNEILQGNALRFNKTVLKDFKPDLPIGTKGLIRGMEYVVTGATVKKENNSEGVYWREYTLYDPLSGYAFLAEYNGHWTYLKEVKLNCAWPEYKTEIYFDGERFILFNDYSFKVRSAAGEFFMSLDSSKTTAREYISPPEMFAVEKTGDQEMTWYKASHINPSEVYEGLRLHQDNMPGKFGVGPLQQMKFYMNIGLLWKMCGIIGLIFMGVQLFFEFSARKETVFQQTYDIFDSSSSQGITSEPFELKASRSNLEFFLKAPVLDTWFEVGVTLVNDKSGTEYSFQKGVEYYSGYSEGEYWTEGSQEGDESLSSIPAGTYHLNIFPSFEPGKNISKFSLSVVNENPMWSNFFIVLGVLAIYPFIVWWRHQSFEKKRWSNSAYNPYNAT